MANASTTFWCYNGDGGGGVPLSFSLPDAIAEMNRLYPGWQSVESKWVMVEVDPTTTPNRQRFWYND